MNTQKKLIVLSGPTAVGKTSAAIELAKHYHTDIISTDSRQFYREMKIGTASPSPSELAQATHHFIGNLSIHDYYNVSLFEQQALKLLDELFSTKEIVIAVGGSGLYIDALCYGIDDFPDIDEKLRAGIKSCYTNEGIEYLQKEVERLDPLYFSQVDKQNPKRLQRALEVILSTGKSYSSQRIRQKKARNFSIEKYVLNMDREILYQRINDRVDIMINDGLVKEARELFPYRHLNALNTVGYKELFRYFENEISLDQAIIDIKTHSRRYAKRQITWFKRDKSFQWISDISKLL